MTGTKPFLNSKLKSAFLVWGPPSHGPRSRILAKELGLKALHYVHATTRRGAWAAPYKYSYQAWATLRLLFGERPDLIFVQSPPSFAVFFVYLYCALTGSKYLVDAHSSALQLRIWTRPYWLHQFLARRAITTIVTNEHFQQQIQSWGASAFILRDIPTNFEQNGSYPLEHTFNVVVVNTFSEDEPLAETLEAAKHLPEVEFYITGKKRMASPDTLALAPANVHFTDFLPDADYYTLLSNAQTVMCLTTRDHTMQRGACEALSLGKPIITSDWPLLRTYFHQGTVHVQNTCEAIQNGIMEMKRHYESYQVGIQALRRQQQSEWQEKVTLLTNLIEQSITKG